MINANLFAIIQTLSAGDKWEDVNMICPHHCVCQYAHRMDLSISRWVHSVETRQRKGHEFIDNDDSAEDPTINNEARAAKLLQ